MIMSVFLVTIDARYDYDAECHGLLGVFGSREAASNFVEGLKGNWGEFERDWHSESNIWGRRFLLSGGPQGLSETHIEIEEWPVQ